MHAFPGISLLGDDEIQDLLEHHSALCRGEVSDPSPPRFPSRAWVQHLATADLLGACDLSLPEPDDAPVRMLRLGPGQGDAIELFGGRVLVQQLSPAALMAGELPAGPWLLIGSVAALSELAASAEEAGRELRPQRVFVDTGSLRAADKEKLGEQFGAAVGAALADPRGGYMAVGGGPEGGMRMLRDVGVWRVLNADGTELAADAIDALRGGDNEGAALRAVTVELADITEGERRGLLWLQLPGGPTLWPDDLPQRIPELHDALGNLPLFSFRSKRTKRARRLEIAPAFPAELQDHRQAFEALLRAAFVRHNLEFAHPMDEAGGGGGEQGPMDAPPRNHRVLGFDPTERTGSGRLARAAGCGRGFGRRSHSCRV